MIRLDYWGWQIKFVNVKVFPKTREEHFYRSKQKRFRISKQARDDDESASDFGEDSDISDAEMDRIKEEEESNYPDLTFTLEREAESASPTTMSESSDGEETVFYDLEPWQKDLEHLLITTPHDILIHDIASAYQFTHTVRTPLSHSLGCDAGTRR